MKLNFKCPDCGDNKLESVEVDVTASSIIADIDEDGDFDYDVPYCDGGYIERFQCTNCGYFLKNEDGEKLTNNLEVIEWINKNCKE